MKSLDEVLQGIEAFKADMEALGADVKVYHGVDVTKPASVAMIRIILEELKEDLEARPCKHGPIPTVGCPKDLEASS